MWICCSCCCYHPYYAWQDFTPCFTYLKMSVFSKIILNYFVLVVSSTALNFQLLLMEISRSVLFSFLCGRFSPSYSVSFYRIIALVVRSFQKACCSLPNLSIHCTSYWESEGTLKYEMCFCWHSAVVFKEP